MEEEKRKLEEARLKEEKRKEEERRIREEERREELKKQEKKREEEKKRAAEEALRIAREKEELQKVKEKEQLRAKPALNSTYTMNSTYTAESKNTPPTSYPMTPQPVEDYGLDDLNSDCSTDDDSAPKKKVPAWAQKHQLADALTRQERTAYDLDVIFPARVLLRVPDLARIVPNSRRPHRKRTSSAIWNTPPSKIFH